jgi:hypothetical protein
MQATLAAAGCIGCDANPIHRQQSRGARRGALRYHLFVSEAGIRDLALSNDEFQLMLCSSRVRVNPAFRQRIRILVQKDLKWDRVVKAATRNAVVPLVYQALKDESAVPLRIREELKSLCVRCAAHNISLARELVRITSLFDKAEIPTLAYKGPALAVLAYGDLSLRQMGDLDIVIPRPHLARARAVLEANGYQSPLTPQLQEYYLKERYHLHFQRGDPKIDVELHWAFTPVCWAFSLDENELWSRTTTVHLAGSRVTTLGPETSLLALSAHGAKERWCRLSMVCDVTALLEIHPELDWEWLLAETRRMGRERVLLLGLKLAQTLFDAELPAQILRHSEGDRQVQSLAAQIGENLRRGTLPQGAWFHLYSLTVWHQRRDWTAYLRSVARSLPSRLGDLARPSERDRIALRLPKRLSFLYYLVRPARAIARYRSPRRILRKVLNNL